MDKTPQGVFSLLRYGVTMATSFGALNYYRKQLSPKERACVRIALESGKELNFGDYWKDPHSFIPYTRRDDVIAGHWKLKNIPKHFWLHEAYKRLQFMRHVDNELT